ncbi:hypothetical protein BX666DRAFT_2002439 [Dichotomocladium elegans]|nr:hypothetical protein BX666DRAFT_2002439 [Dichotomocladium elegans]
MSMLKANQHKYRPPVACNSHKKQPQFSFLSSPPLLQEDYSWPAHHPQRRSPTCSPPLRKQPGRSSGQQQQQQQRLSPSPHSLPLMAPSPLLERPSPPRRRQSPHQRSPSSSSPPLVQLRWHSKQTHGQPHERPWTGQALPSPPDSVISTTKPSCYYYCHPVTGKFVCMVQMRPMQQQQQQKKKKKKTTLPPPPLRSAWSPSCSCCYSCCSSSSVDEEEEDMIPLVFFAQKKASHGVAQDLFLPSFDEACDQQRQRRRRQLPERQRSMPHLQPRQKKTTPHQRPEKATTVATRRVGRQVSPPPLSQPPRSGRTQPSHALPHSTITTTSTTTTKARPEGPEHQSNLSRSASMPTAKTHSRTSPAMLLCGCGRMYKDKPKEKPAAATHHLMSKARRWFSLFPKK